MTYRQTLIELTTIELDRWDGDVNPDRINRMAEEISLRSGGSMLNWWLTTDMTTRSWKLFCSAVVKQLNRRRQYRTGAQPIKLHWPRTSRY